MSILDICILLVLIFNLYKGLRKGFIKMLLDLIAICVCYFILTQHFTKFNLAIEAIIGIQKPISVVVSLGIMLTSVWVILTVINFIANQAMSISGLSILNRFFGLLFGCIKGLIICLPILVGIHHIKPSWITTSKLFGPFTPIFSDLSTRFLG